MKPRSLHLFIADDDRDDRDLFCEAIGSIDPSITCDMAEDGRQALNILSDPAASRPDLIFLDINMPVMSGWDVLKSLKNDGHLRDIPVIVYTTSSGEREKGIAKELGALSFVTKPYSFRALVGLLEGVIGDLKRDRFTAVNGEQLRQRTENRE